MDSKTRLLITTIYLNTTHERHTIRHEMLNKTQQIINIYKKRLRSQNERLYACQGGSIHRGLKL